MLLIVFLTQRNPLVKNRIMPDNKQKSWNNKVRTQIFPAINKEKTLANYYFEYKPDIKTNNGFKINRTNTPHPNYKESEQVMEKKNSVSSMYKEVKKDEEITKTSSIEVSTKSSNNTEYKDNTKKKETIVSSIARVVIEESKEVYSQSSSYGAKGEHNKCNIS